MSRPSSPFPLQRRWRRPVLIAALTLGSVTALGTITVVAQAEDAPPVDISTEAPAEPFTGSGGAYLPADDHPALTQLEQGS